MYSTRKYDPLTAKRHFKSQINKLQNMTHCLSVSSWWPGIPFWTLGTLE